ncbi:DNA modification methylase [Gallintestinimicrobium sp.]|jgi:site-specific DNA-methyltransferase (adenine-specific)|uniref:DNA modification methylase n=1 Tax=Gallintestinimicrobium sp. TaxID=2981655 RepID=UPI003AF412EC
MDIINIALKDLKPYENNPRKNDDAVKYVAESIKEFGFKVPIVIDKNNVIVAGHTRYKAAKKLKMSEVPCIIADDLTDEQIKAFRLADNKVAEKAEWDFDLLNAELDDIIDLDMELFGFEDALQDDAEEAVEDEFEVELPAEPKSKLGDIYQLGNNRLMCGDSTVLEDVEKLMGGEQADMLLTDPPYNVNYEGKTKDKLKIKNDQMGNDNFRQFLTDAFSNADMVMKPGAVFYIWHADSEGYNFRGACFDAGWTVRQCLIWNKNSMVMGRQDYQWKHEPCLYGWKEGAGHLWASDRKQTTVINFDKPTRNDMHPTMKPIPLFDYQIKNNTKGGDVVLDLFGGSGTTIMACEQNGRRGYSMEYDPRYVDVIVDRWEKFTGAKAVLLNK